MESLKSEFNLDSQGAFLEGISDLRNVAVWKLRTHFIKTAKKKKTTTYSQLPRAFRWQQYT